MAQLPGSLNNVLSVADLAALNNIKQSCAGCQQVLNKCKAAGIPGFEPVEEANAQQRMLAEGIKAQFFPNEP